MAKTIKFNLICDGKPVRTLEDLKSNFSIEDVSSYYNNRLLHRWLSVRGYDAELKKVEEIQLTDTLELVKALIKIFDIDSDPVSIEKDTYILQFRKENELLLDEYKEKNYEVTKVIEDYYAGYNKLISFITENNYDIAVIKAAVSVINEKYFDLYELNFRYLFYTFLKSAPLAIFVMLTHERMRNKYLSLNDEASLNDDTEENIVDIDDRANMYGEINRLCSNHQLLSDVLGENMKIYSGVTDGYWKDVETKDKKYMILSMQGGNYVRGTGVSGGDLNSTDINGKFVILEGIDYKSNNEIHKLRYMEV